jgi:protein-S-isoprenylcysteine O-methyltransferase
MNLDTFVRKALFIIAFYVIYCNLIFLFFKPLIYQDFFYLIYILIFYSAGIIDSLLRPLETEKEEEENYASFIVVLFLANPVILVLAIEESGILFDTRVDILSWIGLFLYLVAAIIIIVARVNLGKQGTGTLVIRENHELITTGLYKYLRHPMYTGTLLGVIGFALVSQSIIISLITFSIYFWVFKERIKYEETILEKTFGEKYRKYKGSSYRLIPFLY